MQNLHRPVSNRGQWRGTLTIYADGLPDPSETVFVLAVWPRDARSSLVGDYGWGRGRTGGLATRSDDETGRLAVAVNGASIIVSWLFSPRETQHLAAGDYEGSISAIIGDEMSEIETFRFVVQTRGSADYGATALVLPPPPAPVVPPTPPVPVPDDTPDTIVPVPGDF